MNERAQTSERGQVLPIALAVLLILTIFVPLMVFYTQRDSIWAVKQAATTRAFHLSEAGVEKAYLYISQSTTTWQALMDGTAQAGYNFDVSYSDIDGGTYSVSITSGPASQEVTVVSVGRDKLKREVRSLKVVYGNSVYGAVAIYAGTGAQIGGGVNVEWGGIMSPYTISANSKNHPQFWSASQIITKDTDPSPPNCDSPNCVQWHSYYPNIPPAPAIDFVTYRTSAAANVTGGCPASGHTTTPTGCYYNGAVTSWKETTAGTIFIEGDLTITSPGMYHHGDMVVMGNINLPNGQWGNGPANTPMTMPSDAWKQYGNDWTYYYNNFDNSSAVFPGVNGTHTTPSVCHGATANTTGCTSSKLAVNGMLYVGGNFNNGGGGGGNSDIYGALYVLGSATQTAASGVTFYYNAAASSGLLTTSISLSRISWQDSNYGWPAALP